MVSKQDFAKLALAERVELLNGADDWNGLISTNINSKHPKFTDVTRGGRQKWYEPADGVLKFTIDITIDIVTELITKHTRVNKVLPTFAWIFRIHAKDNTFTDLTINGELSELEFDAPEKGPARANCGVEISDQILD